MDSPANKLRAHVLSKRGTNNDPCDFPRPEKGQLPGQADGVLGRCWDPTRNRGRPNTNFPAEAEVHTRLDSHGGNSLSREHVLVRTRPPPGVK